MLMVKVALALLCVCFVVACSSSPSDPSDSKLETETPEGNGSELHDFHTAAYDSTNGSHIPFDLFPPTAEKNLHRAIVLIHGGGWVGGSRVEMHPIARSLAKDGFTCICIEYTLAAMGTRWPTQLGDVQAAVRYVRSHAKELSVDPFEIAAAGESAGGHLSMFLGVKDQPLKGISSRVQAVGSISGVLDLNAPLTPVGETYGIVQKLLVDSGEPTKGQKTEASPITYVNKSSPPMFFIQGDADPLVPTNQSTATYDKLKSFGIETQFMMVKGMRHGMSHAPTLTDPAEQAALDNFSKWLKTQLKVK